MKGKARFVDIAKNCAIALLFVSAVFLLLQAVRNEQNGVFSGLGSLFGGGEGTSTIYTPGDDSSVLAANPLFLLVTTEDGSHYAVKYDYDVREKMISQFSSALGEALGSSGEPNEISAAEWQKALGGSGVFFDYLYPQPLSSLATWLGTNISSSSASKSARRLFLGDNGGNLLLYYISAEDGTIYRCSTASSFSSLTSKIAEYPMGTANFAFEAGDEYANLDPYFIFSHESGTMLSIDAANPKNDNSDSSDILALFGMNSKVVSNYFESDGSSVFVYGEKTLRIQTSGKVVFSVTGNGGIALSGSAGALTVEDCISACSDIVKSSIGLVSGDAVLGLKKVESSSFPASCTVTFGYIANGIPIMLPNGADAASFEIRGGSIVKAELYYRQYTFSGGSFPSLPEKQATVIAKTTGGEPVLTYEDKTGGVSCTWIKN